MGAEVNVVVAVDDEDDEEDESDGEAECLGACMCCVREEDCPTVLFCTNQNLLLCAFITPVF